uniref:hypothetical protein n=1 Tax=Marinobacterium profundum TaxID=1714300 RepID=UPI00082E37F9|nr:hypothetical protein [Marinobacterium profundum]
MDAFIRLVEQCVDLAAALVWPAAVLVVLYYLREPVSRLLDAVSSRIGDPAADVSISKEGLEFRSRIESLEVDQEQTKSLTLQALGVSQEPGFRTSMAQSQQIDTELLRLANEYLMIEHKDWSQRVNLKDTAALKMADIVVTQSVPRELLIQQQNEGLILALAAASHTLPESGDLELLMQVADQVTRLHVKYRIVMAVGRLFERGVADRSMAESVLKLLTAYRQGADQSLLRRIAYSESTIKNGMGN